MGSSGQEEEAPGIFRAWVEGASGNMALALTALVEQVQSWAKGVGLGGLLTLLPKMDTLGTLLVGWMVFVTLILMLGTFFYFKFIHTLGNETSSEQDDTGPGEEGQGKATKGKGGTGASGSATAGKSKAAKKDEVARKPTIVPDRKPEPVSAPVGTGADPDAVKWTNNVFTWLYNSADGGQLVRKVWLETLNENTVKTAIDTGILVEVVELMKQTPAPVLSNMVVDCSPTDNVTITCDCDATLYLRIITTRTQGDQTTESEYACAVTPLRGRLNLAAVTAELLAVAKFDGWPEVSLKLEGIRNNSTGLNEQQMLDVIDEVLTSALRNSVLEFNFQPTLTFPRFRRARQAPDPIIPVGYDSMVRERQTHPPSAPRKTPKAEFVPLHNEKLEAAGESFTALTFSSNLTSSEEQLIARNLTKYPSLENAEMGPDEIEEFCKTWQENYVPAADVPPPKEEVPEPRPPATIPSITVATHHEEESEPKTQNFVLMVSSRSKLIDEPRNAMVVEEDMDGMEEEEAELADVMPPRRPSDEPCLRKETGSPLLLAAPKYNNLTEPEEDDLEDTKMRFDKLDILEKPQLGGSAGLGPLLKGPFTTTSHSTTSQPMGIPGLNGKRLLVKIVKATGVGCEKPVSEAYSVVEMDEPPQKFTTSVVKDTSSPFWDEQFLFDLSGGTLELLFELYDKTNGNFLGLGIVGIEELVATPSQRQIIPLLSRPYENDEVSGSLTVEFLFLDRADLPDHTLRASTTSQSVTPRGDLVTTTTTTYIKAPDNQGAVGSASPGSYRRRESYRKANNIRSDVIVNGGDSVAAVVLRDIEEKKAVVTNNASKSTMIIHASKKESSKKVIQVQRAPSGEYEEVLSQPDFDEQRSYMTDELLNLMTATTTTATPTITTTGAHTTVTTSTTTATHSAPVTTTADTSEPAENDDRGRSRGNRRKRDSFFGTLKKRFSRSKVRSKSMDPGQRDPSLERDPSIGRSVSMERSSALNRASDEAQPGTPSTQDSAEPKLRISTKIINAFGRFFKFKRSEKMPPGAGGDAGSTRSSLSDASAISSSSTRTYVNEASTLIVETSENGVFKHYLIPLSLQQKSKWRKKGLKLHIFGEHTFVAKHMSSSTQCEVCQKNLGRRFGKQGYICRDCGYKCHKPCHVKTETTCPKSTVNNMDLVTVGEEGREAPPGMHLKCTQTLTSPHSPYHSLPTIKENSNVDIPKCRPSPTLNNGAPCPDSKPVEGGGSTGKTKVQRSISFGNERVKPKFTSFGERQGEGPPPPPSSSPPSTPPAVMDFLLPVLKVENCDSDTMQHR
ncbi:uncharacterized protein LOC127008574 isoform X1 [Eriocheir sinensis]|uniref:uncharacterized protein LOC127008574 isoform X1 n=1 Tax=Eriocheir sinensis TaxID=95602 RepID=UPI0021C764E7|nr:uncharacterized protein LOC127008574 isoform X1 [Eriocheir sinensis]